MARPRVSGRDLLTAAAVLAALWQVPAERLPLAWTLAFAAPVVLLRALQLLFSKRHPGRILIFVLVQASALQLAARHAGGLHEHAVLVAVLIPPCCYLALRRRPHDADIALLLSALVIVGALLLGSGGFSPALLAWTFAAMGVLAWRAEPRPTPLTPGVGPPAEARATHHRALLLAAFCALLGAILLRTGELWPALRELWADEPVQAAGQRPPSGMRVTDRFELGQLEPGSELVLRSSELARVREAFGTALADDLYLRIAAFHVAGLNSWHPGPIRTAPLPANGILRPEWDVDRVGLERYRIERLGPQGGIVYTVPGVTRIAARALLRFDADRMLLREPRPSGPLDYELERQHFDLAHLDRLPLARREGLAELPPELQTPLFARLVRECVRERRDSSALAICVAVRELLQRRCRYERREPAGPHGNALLDFLDGERHGYCMHFASAAAVLLRAQGVPCRVAVGLYGGDPDDEDPGLRHFGSHHAHAWVELPVPELGWVVFDPTPPAYRATGDLPGFETGLGLAPPAPAASEERAPLAFGIEALLWLAGTLLLGLGFARTRPRTRARGRRRPELGPERALLDVLLEALAARGRPRPLGCTLEGFARSLTTEGEALDPRILRAFACYQELRFGARAWTPEREEELRAGIAAAREERLAP